MGSHYNSTNVFILYRFTTFVINITILFSKLKFPFIIIEHLISEIHDVRGKNETHFLSLVAKSRPV